MAITGQCPKCNARISSVRVEPVGLMGAAFIVKTVSYVCPSCSTVLSVGVDHLALQADTVSQVVKELLRALGKD
jgi:hypothetical protein